MCWIFENYIGIYCENLPSGEKIPVEVPPEHWGGWSGGHTLSIGSYLSSRVFNFRVIHREPSIEMCLFQSHPSRIIYRDASVPEQSIDKPGAFFFSFFLFLFKSYVQNLAWLVYKLLSRRACADAGPTHPHYGLR